MRSKYESLKRIYIGIVDIVILLIPTLLFEYIWSRNINGLMHVDFKNKGNWLVIFCFLFLLFVTMYALRGLHINYYKIASLIIAQVLALACTCVIMSIQIILMVGRVATIRIIIISMGSLFLYSAILDSLLTILFVKIYNRFFPPYRLLHIYGDYSNNLKKKILSRGDKYTIEKDIYFDEPQEVLEKEILNYDGVVLNDIPSAKKNKLLKYCFNKRVRIYFVPKISDIFVKSADEINIFDTPLFLCRNFGLTWGQKFTKRVMDIVISCIVLVITSPIILITALAIKLEDGGPIIYSQQRCTKNGKCFMLHKFRSMKVEAEKIGGAQLAKKNDDRITKVGKFIRATRVDELPQLLNILKGDMSFVGPRPERPEFVEKNCREIPEFEYRMKVKAGLTGYAQVYGKYSTGFLDKLKLDLLYIGKYSLLLDIQIVLMTLKVILIKESAEGLEED
jgi:exopolysaccharide biosynthesis polyprenyl glycosylphosphotransferase